MKYKVGYVLRYASDQELFQITQVDFQGDRYTGDWWDPQGQEVHSHGVAYGSDWIEDWHFEYLPGVTLPQPHGYTTEQSGDKQQFASGMQRDTQQGKERFDLVEPLDQPYELRMSTRRAVAMAEGAHHYGARNWEMANTREEYFQFRESFWRHVRKYLAGWTDEDHAAAIEFNLEGAELVKQRLQEKGEWPDE